MYLLNSHKWSFFRNVSRETYITCPKYFWHGEPNLDLILIYVYVQMYISRFVSWG